jgi:hypothetical protein
MNSICRCNQRQTISNDVNHHWNERKFYRISIGLIDHLQINMSRQLLANTNVYVDSMSLPYHNQRNSQVSEHRERIIHEK